MLIPTKGAGKPRRRKGSVLVEYGLLVAGMAMASVVALALLGKKTADVLGVAAATIPGAHAEDNKPISSVSLIPLNTSGSTIELDGSQLVNSGGMDRLQSLLGAGGGELLIEH